MRNNKNYAALFHQRPDPSAKLAPHAKLSTLDSQLSRAALMKKALLARSHRHSFLALQSQDPVPNGFQHWTPADIQSATKRSPPALPPTPSHRHKKPW